MPHEPLPRPEASEIIDTVAEAMRAGIERIDRACLLVPSVFEVYLHPEALQAIEPILPVIQERAALRLDRELERLNEGGALGWAKRLVKPERTETKPYRRAGTRWDVQFFASHDPDVEPDTITVAAELAATDLANVSGPRTRRLTTRLSEGDYRTKVVADAEAATTLAVPPAKPAGERATARTMHGREERVGEGRQPLGRLRFTDDSGARAVLLTASETAIGRRDKGYEWVEVQIDTVDDVSREHLRLRCNREAGSFEIKDLSTFGTTVAEHGGSPHKLAPSIDPESGRDLDRWTPLPDRAVIGLADAIFLEFESLL